MLINSLHKAEGSVCVCADVSHVVYGVMGVGVYNCGKSVDPVLVAKCLKRLDAMKMLHLALKVTKQIQQMQYWECFSW